MIKLEPPALDEHGLPVHRALREAHVRWLMRADIVPASGQAGRDRTLVGPQEDPVERAVRAAEVGAHILRRLVDNDLTPAERRAFRDATKDPAHAELAIRLRIERDLYAALALFEAKAA